MSRIATLMEKMPSVRIGYTRISSKTVHCSSTILTPIIIDALASARSLRSEVPELWIFAF